MSVAPWTSAAQIQAQLQRLWTDGRLLAARLNGEALFPLEFGVRTPGAAILSERYDEVRRWIRELEEGSKTVRGYGYEIAWRDINHRQLGRNRLPAAIALATEGDALRLLGRQADARRFDELATATLAVFPQLRSWLGRRAMTVLEQAPAWERILAILQWFVAHPRPRMYLRQLDIAGVDGKFIENRKGLLAELLDQVLPAAAIDAGAVGARQFEARYDLLAKPALIRFRILDTRLYIGGLSDMAVPVAQFASLKLAVKRVFITENEINGLAFPDVAGAIVIFGGGYGIDRLADVAWLQQVDIDYWGDIDTHGFAILDRLRAILPHARSLLMDSRTLEAHRPLWGSEEKDKRYTGQLTHLTYAERHLFDELRNDVRGERVRMEQERLSFSWVTQAISLECRQSWQGTSDK
ncbi:MAG TPA: hypothetical protein DCW29_15255 [Janthinobacterium sp.]|nr:hypothetical protein [Janthinobacterium sp.]